MVYEWRRNGMPADLCCVWHGWRFRTRSSPSELTRGPFHSFMWPALSLAAIRVGLGKVSPGNCSLFIHSFICQAHDKCLFHTVNSVIIQEQAQSWEYGAGYRCHYRNGSPSLARSAWRSERFRGPAECGPRSPHVLSLVVSAFVLDHAGTFHW